MVCWARPIPGQRPPAPALPRSPDSVPASRQSGTPAVPGSGLAARTSCDRRRPDRTPFHVLAPHNGELRRSLHCAHQFGLSCNSPPPAGVLLGVAYALSLPADEPLRLRAVAGDEAAFESLLRPLVEPGLRLALSMLGDRRDAEDATQEALTRAWRKLHQLRRGCRYGRGTSRSSLTSAG